MHLIVLVDHCLLRKVDGRILIIFSLVYWTLFYWLSHFFFYEVWHLMRQSHDTILLRGYIMRLSYEIQYCCERGLAKLSYKTRFFLSSYNMWNLHIVRGMSHKTSHKIRYSHLSIYQFHAPSCICLYTLVVKDDDVDNDSDHNNNNYKKKRLKGKKKRKRKRKKKSNSLYIT